MAEEYGSYIIFTNLDTGETKKFWTPIPPHSPEITGEALSAAPDIIKELGENIEYEIVDAKELKQGNPVANDELAVSSERPSLESVSQTLAAIKGTRDTEELATLLLMVTEFYGDGQCRCEELEASYGEDSEEARLCQLNVNRSRDEMLATYRDIIKTLKGE